MTKRRKLDVNEMAECELIPIQDDEELEKYFVKKTGINSRLLREKIKTETITSKEVKELVVYKPEDYFMPCARDDNVMLL